MFRDRPLIPLLVLLRSCSSCSSSSPGPEIISAGWVGDHAPGGRSRSRILAGCQTLDDADRRHRPVRRRPSPRCPGSSSRRSSAARGSRSRIVVALRHRRAGRRRHRHRRRRLPRPPADHDPGHGPGRASGWPTCGSWSWSRPAPACRPILRTLGSASALGILPNSLLVFIPLAVFILVGCSGGRATAGCSTRSATTRSPRGCPVPGRGRCWSSCTSSRRSSPPSPGS